MKNKQKVNISSPFLSQRREREGHETKVFINYSDYPVWVSMKNCLISGSRGTGKSSVLSSFDYRTRWFHPNCLEYCEQYKQQYEPANQAANTMIGIMFKADRIEANLWDLWHENNDSNGAILFASYLVCYFIEHIIISVKEIVNEFFPEEIRFLQNKELLSRLFNQCHLVPSNPFSALYSFSIDGLLSYVSEQKSAFRKMVYQGLPMSDVPNGYLLESASSGFISDFCSILVDVIPSMRDKRFFLMIDDVDRLKTWQVKTINSFLKVATMPCSWKLSTSFPYQTMSTEDDSRISGTDLKISILNDENIFGREQRKDRIDELYEAIFRMRISQSGLKVQEVDLRKLFGRADLEASIRLAIDGSMNDGLKSLYAEFEKSGRRFFTDYWLENRRIVTEKSPRKKYDKYRINAAFALIAEYGLEKSFRYGSYDVIRALCAGSPRHFLRICDSMWGAIHYSLIRDGRKMVSVEDQDYAIRTAAKELFENIDRDQFDRTISASCKDMAERLAELFQFLTRNHDSLRISQECLSLRIDLGDFKEKEKRERFMAILNKLTIIEALKIQKENRSDKVSIGLNPMLSPCFFLPFRSPFMNTLSIDANLLYSYLTIKEDVSNVFKMICSNRTQEPYPSLF